jgi:peptide/nickel transport system ATP-binding protein
VSALLEVANLAKIYSVGGTGTGPDAPAAGLLHAVDDISFAIDRGESVGLVGESGCGKSTVVRLVARLIDPSAGTIRFADDDIGGIAARRFGRDPRRRAIQVVFQDPTDSLNPRFSAFDTIVEPVRLLDRDLDAAARRTRAAEAAQLVGLPEELLPRLPHQLSGGQKARVNIARAIAVRPELLVLDEPTSALDVSVQAVILRLLADLRAQLDMSYLFVSHDLNVVRLLCQRLVVMYLGKIVEMGTVEDIFTAPRHPYTRALIDAIPGHAGDPRPRLAGEPMSPIDPDPATCRLYGRCPLGQDRCRQEMPQLDDRGGSHPVACHTPLGTAST